MNPVIDDLAYNMDTYTEEEFRNRISLLKRLLQSNQTDFQLVGIVCESIYDKSIKRFGLNPFDWLPNILLSYSSDITTGYQFQLLHFLKVNKMTSSKFNYSSSAFIDGYRKKDNWIEGNNCVILDVDGGWTLQEAIQYIQEKNLLALVTTTKSHQIEKNELIDDRFRIILPTKTGFKGTVEQFSGAMKNIHGFFLDKPDPAAKDVSRFYYGYSKQEWFYLFGSKLLDWNAFLPGIPGKKSKTLIPGNIEFHIEGIINAASLAKVGERNKFLYWAYQRCKDYAIDPYPVLQKINSKLAAPLEDSEIKKICRI